MRSVKPSLIFLLSLFVSLLLVPAVVRADDEKDDAPDDYDVSARVVRVSFMSGVVSVKRHDGEEWEAARLNTPLVEGDTITTAKDGRAEIQIDARNWLRLGADSVLQIVTLRNEGIAISLSQGTATLRLARFERDKEYFEIDAPKSTIAAESKGVYRLDADKSSIRVTVREGGQARVYSDTAGFTVREGHSSTLNLEGNDAGDWQLAAAATGDAWDDWVTERESYLAKQLTYDNRYYEADVWGGEDLNSYGTWSNTTDYGYVWRPNVTIINNYSDWAPYRFGSWVWCAPYGWTWIGDEPFGWAPYHYGRWVYYDNYWAWCPHSFYPHHRNWWRPALVGFVALDFNHGSHFGWYPLHYRQRDPRSIHFGRGRSTALRLDGFADLRHANRAYWRAISSVPANGFGHRDVRPQPADSDIARRVATARPVRGDWPVRPSTSGRNESRNGSGANGAGSRADRRTREVPAEAFTRPTGAARRTAGTPLDNELRRTRMFNGRQPSTGTVVNIGNNSQGTSATPTGAVARPSRRDGPSASRGSESNGGNTTPVERTTRSTRVREDRRVSDPNASNGSSDRQQRTPRVAIPTTDSGNQVAQPKRERERPERIERPSQPRVETPRQQPPVQTVQPAPRPEPVRQSPPAQRSEAPRYAPPPQRSESPRPAPTQRRSESSRPSSGSGSGSKSSESRSSSGGGHKRG